jgi:hypothetical protein
MYISYAGLAGILLLIKGNLIMGKVKSSRCRSFVSSVGDFKVKVKVSSSQEEWRNVKAFYIL